MNQQHDVQKSCISKMKYYLNFCLILKNGTVADNTITQIGQNRIQ